MTSDLRVINVAVHVTAETRPKDLSHVLDEAFEDWDAVVEFTVEGYRDDRGSEGESA
jgi:hypothetical protein